MRRSSRRAALDWMPRRAVSSATGSGPDHAGVNLRGAPPGGFTFGACGAAAGFSQPPGGGLTSMASAGCGSAAKLCPAPLPPRRGRRGRWRVEPRRHVVAFLVRVLVALLRGEREPFVGFGEICFDADAARVKDAEVVLAVGNAAVGSLAEPLSSVAVIGIPADAFGVEHGKVMHRLGVPLAGGGGVETARGLEVFPHPLAFLIETSQPVLCRGEAVVRGALEPAQRLLATRRNATPFRVAQREFVFGGGIAGEGGTAQSRSDLGRHRLFDDGGRRPDRKTTRRNSIPVSAPRMP